MPRVHKVERALKDRPKIGVKKGESYYWWKVRLKGCKSGTRYESKEMPKPSQLTQSQYLKAIYELQEENWVGRDFDGIEDRRNDVMQRIQEILDEQQEKLDNMPDGLQQGDTGQLIQERIDCLQSAIDDLEGIEIPEESDYNDNEELKEEYGDIDTWKDEEANSKYEEIDNAISSLE
jgi:hypothetical protein